MNKFLKVVAILLCPVILCSCATIISGRTQKTSITTNPSGAIVLVNNVRYQSPAIVYLDRSVPSYQIIIMKDGYENMEYTITRGLNGWVFGNLLVGGIIGIVIDCVSNSVHAFYPGDITANLIEIEPNNTGRR